MLETLGCYFYSKQGREYKCTRYIEALKCNHFCRGKAINITYSGCVSVTLVI